MHLRVHTTKMMSVIENQIADSFLSSPPYAKAAFGGGRWEGGWLGGGSGSHIAMAFDTAVSFAADGGETEGRGRVS